MFHPFKLRVQVIHNTHFNIVASCHQWPTVPQRLEWKRANFVWYQSNLRNLIQMCKLSNPTWLSKCALGGGLHAGERSVVAFAGSATILSKRSSLCFKPTFKDNSSVDSRSPDVTWNCNGSSLLYYSLHYMMNAKLSQQSFLVLAWQMAGQNDSNKQPRIILCVTVSYWCGTVRDVKLKICTYFNYCSPMTKPLLT